MVLVDAVSRGGPPGTLYVIESEPGADDEPPVSLSHELDAAAVLRMAAHSSSRCRRVVIVGCEPQSLGDELDGEMGLEMGLSHPVAAAVEQAANVALTWATQLGGDESCS